MEPERSDDELIEDLREEITEAEGDGVDRTAQVGRDTWSGTTTGA